MSATPPGHPVADLVPPMTPGDYSELRESIRLNGQREPITLHRDGRIIDGRHRMRACIELGLLPETQVSRARIPSS
jgi:ParB-like chromosome segregation protein Spo0J